jgi:tetratricopeptide (TPR) repeat protein
VRDRILARAEGVPLYAVETVRMLLDRGLLVREGPAYQLTGPVEALEVPETLHALIAARLDGLTADERRLLQDAAVLGKTFTREALAALAGADTEIESLLTALVRKEVFGVQADPRSPEHGQYGFLQDLVRRVAYETLSRRERRARHLAAAAHLRAAFAEDEDEVVEVIASHYLAAHEALPEADDSAEIKGKAQAMLARAGEHAASLAAAAAARRYYEQAADLTDDPSERAALLASAGEMAMRTGDPRSARQLYEESIELHEQSGDARAAARVQHKLAWTEAAAGKQVEAIARLERALAVLVEGEPDEDLALIAAMLGLAYWFGGDLEKAGARAELALDIAEPHAYYEPLARALRAKAGIANSRGHHQEATALLKRALEIALEHDLTGDAGSCLFWLSDRCFQRDAYAEALGYLDESLALSRKLGSRPFEWAVLAERTYPLFMRGHWDEVQDAAGEFTQERLEAGSTALSLLQSAVEVHIQRGELDGARRVLEMFSRGEHSTDLQERSSYLGARAALRRAEGRLREALADAEATIETGRNFGISSQSGKQGIVEALEAAVALGEVAKIDELLGSIDAVPPGTRPPYLDAQALRFRGRLAEDDDAFAAAAARFRELELPFYLAVTLLEHAEGLTGRGQPTTAEPLLAEATEIFERLEARPWLERATRLAAAGEEPEPVAAGR